MSKVAVMTDSVSLLTPEIAETYGITVVSTHITMDGKDYLDTDINPSEFYAQLPQLREAEKFPTTSSPSISDYLEAYRELGKKVKSILCVAYSPRLGIAYNAATKAKEMVRGKLDKVTIEIINSGSCCGAQMLIALEAAKAAAKGKNGNKKLHAVINHANVPDEAEELKRRLLSRFDCAELYVTPVLPLIAIHNGLGCIWLAWYGED
ncbi:MAG: DegV family EDD domain-containing protein [Dehalococcoidia bacterium]|nr:DegV family EDD domain-containing protein [Dehalococcoidia bacterium]MDH5781619.1 DegV family EDD domain-containing protein [Dehalococcoidia bacterium]